MDFPQRDRSVLPHLAMAYCKAAMDGRRDDPAKGSIRYGYDPQTAICFGIRVKRAVATLVYCACKHSARFCFHRLLHRSRRTRIWAIARLPKPGISGGAGGNDRSAWRNALCRCGLSWKRPERYLKRIWRKFTLNFICNSADPRWICGASAWGWTFVAW